MTTLPTSPFDAVRQAVNVLGSSRETEFLHTLSPHDLLTLALGCMRSDWDVTIDNLGTEQMRKLLSGQWLAPKFDHCLHPAGGVPSPRRGQLSRQWVVKNGELGYWDLGFDCEGGSTWHGNQADAARFTRRRAAKKVAARLGNGTRVVRLRRRPSARDTRLGNILRSIILHLESIVRPVPPLERAAQMPILGLHDILAELDGIDDGAPKAVAG